MVGREVDGPLCAVLGRSWGLCWRSWCGLGTYVGGPGPLLGLNGRSWAALGASVAGLGLLLEPMLAVLGRSWGLCGRSWAVLAPLWAVLGGHQAEKWPRPERESDLGTPEGHPAISSPPVLLRIYSIDVCVYIYIY